MALSILLYVPISVKKIRDVLGKLKEELDREKRHRDAVSGEIAHYESLKSYIEERFISLLVMGGLRRPVELERQKWGIPWASGARNSKKN